MEQPLRRISKLQDQRHPAIAPYIQKLAYPYFNSMFAMLFVLLKISKTKVNHMTRLNYPQKLLL